MTVLSEKGKKITIKSEIATSSKKSFKEHPIEMIEEASKRKFEVVGTDIEPEYEDLDTADEEEDIGKLNKDEREIVEQYKEFYTIQARSKGNMPGFQYIHWLKVRDCYPGIPTDITEVLSQPNEGEVQDIDWMTGEDIIMGIERWHTTVPRRKVNVRPNKGTVILYIDPDSNSDVIIEEGETDFKMRCLIMKKEKKDKEEEAEQADDEQYEQPTEATTKPETTLASEQETEDKDEMISSTSTQDFNWEKVEREFINLALHLQADWRKFWKTGRRGAICKEMSVGYSPCKNAYLTDGQSNNVTK